MTIWSWFCEFLFNVLSGLESFCHDWGLSIILLTLIIRVLLTPLQTKSIKSSAQMQILQPKIKEIQELYKDDPMRLQQEMRQIYSEHKFNPLGGCLPVILQMPVFFALFTALKMISERAGDASFFNILPNLSTPVSQIVSEQGWAASWVYIVFVVLFGVLTLIPMLLNMQNNQGGSKGPVLVMGILMCGLMMWFGWSVGAGLLLYYDTSALWGVVQQVTITRYMMDKYKKEMAEKMKFEPVKVDVVRKEQKPRPKKKGKK